MAKQQSFIVRLGTLASFVAILFFVPNIPEVTGQPADDTPLTANQLAKGGGGSALGKGGGATINYNNGGPPTVALPVTGGGAVVTPIPGVGPASVTLPTQAQGAGSGNSGANNADPSLGQDPFNAGAANGGGSDASNDGSDSGFIGQAQGPPIQVNSQNNGTALGSADDSIAALCQRAQDGNLNLGTILKERCEELGL